MSPFRPLSPIERLVSLPSILSPAISTTTVANDVHHRDSIDVVSTGFKDDRDKQSSFRIPKRKQLFSCTAFRMTYVAISILLHSNSPAYRSAIFGNSLTQFLIIKSFSANNIYFVNNKCRQGIVRNI